MSIDRHHAEPLPVRVLTEREIDGAWVFDVEIGPPEGQTIPSRLDLHLSWADYEHWCHGATSPERVAKAVVECLMELKPEYCLPRRLDASTARRLTRGELDDRVRERVGNRRV